MIPTKGKGYEFLSEFFQKSDSQVHIKDCCIKYYEGSILRGTYELFAYARYAG